MRFPLRRGGNPDLVVAILFAMLGIVVLAGLVVLYVAYPHRGQPVPNAPWLGVAMRKGVNRLPTVDNQRDSRRTHRERVDQHH